MWIRSAIRRWAVRRSKLPHVAALILLLGSFPETGESIDAGTQHQLYITSTIGSSSDSLSPFPKGSLDGPRRIQTLRFSFLGEVEVGDTFPADIRSAGMAVYYPSSRADRYRGAADPAKESGAPLLYIANWLQDEVLVFDTGTGNIVDSIAAGRNPGGLVISPDGNTLYTTLEQGSGVAVIDRAAGVRSEIIQLENAKPFGIGITPDGSMLLVCDESNGGRVHAVDIASRTVVRSLSTGAFPEQVAVNAEGSLAYVTAYAGGNLNVIDLSTLKVIARLDAPHAIGVALDPRGRWIYATNAREGTMLVFEVGTHDLVAEWLAGGPGSEPSFIRPTPNGERVLVSNRFEDFLTVVDVERNTSENITIGSGFGPMVLVPEPAVNGATKLHTRRDRATYDEWMSGLRATDEQQRQSTLAELQEINNPRLTLRAMMDLSESGREQDEQLALDTLSELLDSFAGGGPGARIESVQKVVASLIVNRARRLQEANLETYRTSARGAEDIARARSDFFSIWREKLVTPCSDKRLGSAGVRCVSERGPGGSRDWHQRYLGRLH